MTTIQLPNTVNILLTHRGVWQFASEPALLARDFDKHPEAIISRATDQQGSAEARGQIDSDRHSPDLLWNFKPPSNLQHRCAHPIIETWWMAKEMEGGE
jgi:hypothetical protein